MADELDETPESPATATPSAPEAAEPAEDDDSTMRALVEYMARSMVTQPDEVSVTTVQARSSVIFELRVAPDDMGKIIGKDGRVAKAMRSLLKVAAAREHERAILEIV